jgi:hypothetical protein
MDLSAEVLLIYEPVTTPRDAGSKIQLKPSRRGKHRCRFSLGIVLPYGVI